MSGELLTVLCGDSRRELKKLPAGLAHVCVTSPPYYGLRDYGTEPQDWGGDPACEHVFNSNGHKRPKPDRATVEKDANGSGVFGGERGAQESKAARGAALSFGGTCVICGAWRGSLGLEPTPEMYVEHLVEVFREVRRVLRDDGTLWLNLGDSYWGGKGENGSSKARATAAERDYQQSGGTVQMSKRPQDGRHAEIKPKDLIGIPWMVAFALRADGWYLRSDVIEEVEMYCPCGCGYILEERIWRHSQDRDIIWKKPNPMPESVTDRPTKAHEYIFLLSKGPRYYYDAEAIKEPFADERMGNPGAYKKTAAGERKACNDRQDLGFINNGGGWNTDGTKQGRNKRSVWTVPTVPFPGAHFATFPPELIKPCILAGTSARGCCRGCGAPWRRVTEKGLTAHDGETNSAYAEGSTANRLARLRQAARERGGEYVNERRTVGWAPSCRCDVGEPVPCVVLDPFGGSGTTGKVAIELGRRAVLVELNPDYVPLIEERTTTTAGLPF